MAVPHLHPLIPDTPDPDTDPEPFGVDRRETGAGQEAVTSRYCSICGRDYSLYTLPELQRWLKLQMTDQEAANVVLAFKLWADKL